MRVLLVPNTRYELSVAAARDLTGWLADRGIEPVLAAEDAIRSGLEAFSVPPSSIGEPVLVVALGGDGTILKAVHLLGEIEAPLLGVNLGHLGFLTGASADKMTDALEAALSGECRVERRNTLIGNVVMDGRPVGRHRALNEIAIGRANAGRVIDISLSVNGVEIACYSCDGTVVATATGSTAYALSAGGPIVSPELRCAVVVPVAPHTLTKRSIVAAPGDVIELRLPDPARRGACLSVDGDPIPCRQAIESVSVSTCEYDVLLVKLDGRDFYEVVHAEFYGGR